MTSYYRQYLFSLVLFLSLIVMVTATHVAAEDLSSKSLFVYCAGGMQKPIAALSKEFENQTGVKVDVTYHGTNTLLGQIKLARRGDVYIAGDADYIEQARKDSLVSSTKTICWFVPVIMVKKGNPRSIKTLSDLTKAGIKLGQGDDKAAAVGRIMPKILAMNGVDTTAWSKNIRLITPTGNELGLAFKLGTLDATVVWSVIADNYLDVAEQIKIPLDKNVIPQVDAAVLRFSRDTKLSTQYLEFITSDHARKVLKDNGYIINRPTK